MTSNTRLKVAIGISGSGRSLKNLLSHQSEKCDYQIVGVFSSNADAQGLSFAVESSLPIFINPFNSSLSASRFSPDHQIYDWLDHIGANFVALAGFIRPFPLKTGWENRIINIHPSLLPKFGGKGMYGMRVHQAVLESGEKMTGATIHYVNEEYDKGAIIDQEKVLVNQGDSPTSLANRVFEAECQLYPKVLQLLAKNIKT